MEVSGSLAGGWWLRLEENQTLLLFFFSIWGPFAINAYSSRYFPQPAEEGYVSAVVLSLNLGSKMWSPFKIQSHSGHTQSIILILGIEDWLKKKKKNSSENNQTITRQQKYQCLSSYKLFPLLPPTWQIPLHYTGIYLYKDLANSVYLPYINII